MAQTKKNRRPDTKWLEAKTRIWEYLPDENEEALQPFAIRLDLYSFRFDLMMGENSFRKPSFTTFARICEALNANPTYLLFGKGNKYLNQLREHPTEDEMINYCVHYFVRLKPDASDRVMQGVYDKVKGRVNEERKVRGATLPHVPARDETATEGPPEKPVPCANAGRRSISSRRGPKRRG